MHKKHYWSFCSAVNRSASGHPLSQVNDAGGPESSSGTDTALAHRQLGPFVLFQTNQYQWHNDHT